MLNESSDQGVDKRRLFILSFSALFLELMVIRWVPSQVRFVAYYANLMLLSSFLGLGIGAIIPSRNWNVFRWFPVLFALNIAFLLWIGDSLSASSSDELRFGTSIQGRVQGYLVLVLTFVSNAAMFVPIGEAIGRQFGRLQPLRAYSWDLAGSLCGTLIFGVFSLLAFSPSIGLCAVAGLVLIASSPRHRVFGALIYGATIVAIWMSTPSNVFWSPYYSVTVSQADLKVEMGSHGTPVGKVVSRIPEPIPDDLQTMLDPPIYQVRVNQDFYQMDASIDPGRYPEDSWKHQLISRMARQYALPYRMIEPPERVLVLGAGGGMDVETALLNGARHVDAVEIDPQIAQLSNRLNAAAPYTDPRVTLHIDDGRAFLERCKIDYDLVLFGYLDSQALASYGANLRLDGYIYTVESFRKAYGRVRDDGAMVVWFAVVHDWLAEKLVQMVEEASGRAPYVYVKDNTVAIIVPKGSLSSPPPPRIAEWSMASGAHYAVDLATDNWPYLYLAKRGIPRDYAIVIGLLLVISVGAVLLLRGPGFGFRDSHFLFLGWGFLLLQTKGIGDCSLYFGATWLVTTLVITGVLLMVLLANWVTVRFVRKFSPRLYFPLFISLLLLLAFPREAILAQDMWVRVAWTVLMVPLPVFFAGLIFSTTFRVVENPSACFGSNLIGATIGGFCEYLGMWIGSDKLGFIVFGAYACSLACVVLAGRRGRGVSGIQPA